MQIAVVPLSEERLRRARRALRECVHLQPIRSHIAQALAAGLGFRNDAALRARMQARPDAAPFDPTAFCRRLAELKSPCAAEDHRRLREAVAASAAAAGDGWSRIDAYIAHTDQKALVAPWFADICSAPQLHAMRRSRLDRSAGLRIFCSGYGESIHGLLFCFAYEHGIERLMDVPGDPEPERVRRALSAPPDALAYGALRSDRRGPLTDGGAECLRLASRSAVWASVALVDGGFEAVHRLVAEGMPPDIAASPERIRLLVSVRGFRDAPCPRCARPLGAHPSSREVARWLQAFRSSAGAERAVVNGGGCPACAGRGRVRGGEVVTGVVAPTADELKLAVGGSFVAAEASASRRGAPSMASRASEMAAEGVLDAVEMFDTFGGSAATRGGSR